MVSWKLCTHYLASPWRVELCAKKNTHAIKFSVGMLDYVYPDRILSYRSKVWHGQAVDAVQLEETEHSKAMLLDRADDSVVGLYIASWPLLHVVRGVP